MAGTGKAAKLVIFGANGFVGTHVARLAVASGIQVVSASRSGEQPLARRNEPAENRAWIDQVEWSKVDALDRANICDFLDYHGDADAVFSAVGGPTLDHKRGRRVNGDANVNIAAAIYDRPNIRRMVYMSATVWTPGDRILRGCYEGKFAAERAMAENLGARGCVFRPMAVSGTRVFKHGIAVPLHWFLGPMAAVVRPAYSVTGWPIFTPPIRAEDVAKAGIYAALQEPLPERCEIAEYHDILEKASHFQSMRERLDTSTKPTDTPTKSTDGASNEAAGVKDAEPQSAEKGGK